MILDRLSLRSTPVARRYEALSERERRLVLVAVAVAAVAIVYLGVVAPVQSFHDEAVGRYRQQQAQLEWMQLHRGEVPRQTQDSGQQAPTQSLLTLIDSTARQFDLRLASYRSESSGGVSVVVQEQPFNDVLRWMERLASQHGLEVVQASIDAHGAGRVNARFVIR